MKWQAVTLLDIFLMNQQEKLLVGRLALKDRQIYFEYDSSFIKTGLEISPLKLPLKTGVIRSEDPVFEGLFGVFNDSLPDGWGRLLLDRKLMQLGYQPQALSPLDRLCYVGHHGMGALRYEPAIENALSVYHENLDEIAEEIIAFQEHDAEHVIDDLLQLNGSSAGARPKIVIRLGQEDWLIKFPSSLDPYDIGPIEYAYHLMAIEAKLEVPAAKLFSSKKNPGYFGVKRFDRTRDQCLHMHTISGLLHADHRIPTLDYETILRATLWLTKDVREGEKLFRLAVFNVLSHNRDDHAKNFSFLMDEKGEWKLSPVYDLTFSSGPNGEHCSTMMGEGKNPTVAHLLKLAEVGNIRKQKAIQVIEEVKSAVLQWEKFGTLANVKPESISMIKNTLKAIGHLGG